MGKRGPKSLEQVKLLEAQRAFIKDNGYPASIAKLARVIGVKPGQARRSAVHMRDAGIWRQRPGSAKYWPTPTNQPGAEDDT